MPRYTKADALGTILQAIETEQEALEDGSIYDDATPRQVDSMVREFERVRDMIENRAEQRADRKNRRTTKRTKFKSAE